MPQTMVVYVCSTAAKAAQAQQVLLQQGFPAEAVTVEPVGGFVYDAETYASGTSDSAETVWIVTGRL